MCLVLCLRLCLCNSYVNFHCEKDITFENLVLYVTPVILVFYLHQFIFMSFYLIEIIKLNSWFHIFMFSKAVFLDTPFAVKFNIVWANNVNFFRFSAHFPSNFLVGRRWLHIMLCTGQKICISGFSGNTFLTSLGELRTNTDMLLLCYHRLYYSLLVLILRLRFPDLAAVLL